MSPQRAKTSMVPSLPSSHLLTFLCGTMGEGTAHIRIEHSPDKVEGFKLSDAGISGDGTVYHGEAAVE